jgi:hypothetical protein
LKESFILNLKCEKMKKNFKFSVIVVVFSFLLINLLTTNEAKAVVDVRDYGFETIWCPPPAPFKLVYRCTEQGTGCCISCQELCYD